MAAMISMVRKAVMRLSPLDRCRRMMSRVPRRLDLAQFPPGAAVGHCSGPALRRVGLTFPSLETPSVLREPRNSAIELSQEIAMDAHEHRHDHGAGHGNAATSAVKDPVCGMTVDPATAKHRSDFEGQPYYFCGAGCRQKFTADPHKYLARPEQGAAKSAPPASGPGETLWTCPMHPEIIRKGPGSCPICGMALEPMTPSATDEANPELADMTRRFWVGVALSVPLLAIVMAEHVSDHAFEGMLPGRVAVWLQLVLATPVVLWGGAPFFARGWASLVNRRLNMFTLIALGTGVAYGYSLVAAFVPDIFPASFRSPDGQVDLYFEAASVIVTLVLLRQVLELRAR